MPKLQTYRVFSFDVPPPRPLEHRDRPRAKPKPRKPFSVSATNERKAKAAVREQLSGPHVVVRSVNFGPDPGRDAPRIIAYVEARR